MARLQHCFALRRGRRRRTSCALPQHEKHDSTAWIAEAEDLRNRQQSVWDLPGWRRGGGARQLSCMGSPGTCHTATLPTALQRVLARAMRGLPPCECMCHAQACAMRVHAPCAGLSHASACAMRGLAPCAGLCHASACAILKLAPCASLSHASACAMRGL
eukprot:45863-Chlamydomonas_euryale.AAC.1